MQMIYIDISNKSVLPTIYAKQGDIGRKFKAIISNSGVAYQITSESFTASYDGASGSGHYDQIEGRSAFEVSQNTVVVELAPNIFQAQMSLVPVLHIFRSYSKVNLSAFHRD